MQPSTARDGRLWCGAEPFCFVGTHAELMANEGLYARMFTAQADGYRIESDIE